jgi:hypothetical protein
VLAPGQMRKWGRVPRRLVLFLGTTTQRFDMFLTALTGVTGVTVRVFEHENGWTTLRTLNELG